MGQALYGKLGIAEAELALVESGCAPAPGEWRAKLIALAQQTAFKALESASSLLCR